MRLDIKPESLAMAEEVGFDCVPNHVCGFYLLCTLKQSLAIGYHVVELSASPSVEIEVVNTTKEVIIMTVVNYISTALVSRII